MARCRLISNLILSTSLACIGLQPSAHAAIGDNLELYLELNEAAGLAAADSSGNGRTGAVVNRGGNLQNITLDGDPLPGDPLANDTYFWTPGRFGGGFAPGGAPDADGDPNPPFCNGDMCLDEDEFGNKQPSHYQGSAYAMVGVNLTNGATTGGIPAEIESQQFTYSFHVRMPYNRRYSKTVGGYIEGSETVTRDQVMFDAHSVAPSGWGLDSSQTNFWNGTVLSGSPLDHMSGTNRWTWFQVNDQDQLFYHYRGGAVDLRTVNDPALFDLSTSNGDYNLDGSTDIADYVLWRDNLVAQRCPRLSRVKIQMPLRLVSSTRKITSTGKPILATAPRKTCPPILSMASGTTWCWSRTTRLLPRMERSRILSSISMASW